jgi:flagellar motility protein MotE (MotC chaperone)
MSLHLPAPRLLPLAIVALTALLAVKSAWLVRGWLPRPVIDGLAMVNVARAEGPEKGHAPPANAHMGPSTPPPKHGEAAPQRPEPVPEPSPVAGPPPVSDAERALLLELRQRRQDLERRDSTVTARESVLTAAEQKIAARVDEMRDLQKRLETLDAARQQRDDAGWQGLVKTYEAMKPREAAAIFNDLAMSVLLPLIGHMKEAKAASVLAAMSPDKARDVTSQLAKSRTRPDTLAEPVSANPSRPPPNKS